MDKKIKSLIDELSSKNNKIRKNALDMLLEITNEKVDWIYNVWDIMIEKLDSTNSYQRSIGIFILSNLAKSDYDKKFLDIIDRYLELMEDEKFITSRQTILSSWKVAVALEPLRSKIVDYLIKMFSDNKHLSSHANLIRKDIAESLINIHKEYKDSVDLNQIKLKMKMYCDKKERKNLERLLSYKE